MPQDQRPKCGGNLVSANPEQFAPGAGTQKPFQARIRTGEQQAGLIEQRRGIARAIARIGRRRLHGTRVHGVERGLGPRKPQPRQRVECIVKVSVARRDLAASGDRAFVVERVLPRLGQRRYERERPAVGQLQPLFAGEAVERGEIGTAPGCEPAGVEREARVQTIERAARAQCRPPREITITMPMMTASTRNAIFHGLFGYSPWIAPVTPFCTHWKLLAP